MAKILPFKAHFPELILFLMMTSVFVFDSQSSQLYIQPAKSELAYFTGDNFFVTCFTTGDNIEMLTWTDSESTPVSTENGRIHAEHAEGDQVGLRLVFTNVEIEDAGTYTCSDDQDSVSFDLRVYQSISFGDTPSVQHVPESDIGVLLCFVKADTKPIVNWYFEGKKISSDMKYQIKEVPGRKYSILKIYNLTRADAGEYKCKAVVLTHLNSQIKDFNIKLRVQYEPEIIGKQHVSMYANVGSKINIICTITADPIPMFQWVHDEMIIYNNTKKSIIYNTENSSVLQMEIDSKEQFGEYSCRASNLLGEKEVTIDLKEGNDPEEPFRSKQDFNSFMRLSPINRVCVRNPHLCKLRYSKSYHGMWEKVDPDKAVGAQQDSDIPRGSSSSLRRCILNPRLCNPIYSKPYHVDPDKAVGAEQDHDILRVFLDEPVRAEQDHDIRRLPPSLRRCVLNPDLCFK